MNTLTLIIHAIFACVLTLFATQAEAHKIRVFAYENNGEIVAEVKFSSGRPAKQVLIEVIAENNSPLLSGRTDNNGEYRFSTDMIPKGSGGNLIIIANDGAGHRGTWSLEEADYLGTTPDHSLPVKEVSSATAQENNSRKSLTSTPPLDFKAVEDIVENTVAREIAPLKKMLAEQKHDKVSIQDILGGLGYILGLAGIAAYYKSKK